MKSTHILRLFLRHWLVIGLVTVAVGAAAFAVSATRTPQYTATSSVYLTIASGSSPNDLAQGSTYLQNQMDSFGELATSSRVLNAVIDDLHLDSTAKDLAKQVTAVIPRNTVILEVSASDADPRAAASIANAITVEFGQQLATVGPKSATKVPLIEAESIQVALPPTVQTSPNTKLNTLLGLIVGFALGCGAVYLAARLDDKLRTTDRVAALGLGDVLGSLRQVSSLGSDELVVLQKPEHELASEFRRLSASLENAAGSGPHAIVVTSANRADGRTLVAANLAAALAERGSRVALVDADLRSPRIATLTGAAPEPGLLQRLTKEDAALALQQPDGVNFDVVAAGGHSDNPAAALSGSALHDTLDEIATTFDYVIFDGAPLLPVPDTISLGKNVPDLIVVGNARRTSRAQLTAAVRSATAAGLNTLGIVLNQVRPADESIGRSHLSSRRRTGAAQQRELPKG